MDNLSLGQLEALVVFLIVLVVAVFGGLILYVILSSRQKAAREKAEFAGQLPASSTTELSPAGRRPISLLRGDDGLQVEVGGTRYRTFAEIKDSDTKRQVLMAALDLVRFTGVLGQDVAAPLPMDKTYSWREDLRQVSQEELGQIRGPSGAEPGASKPANRSEIEEQFLSMLAEMGQAPAPPEKPKLVTSLQQVLRPKGAEEPPHSFVEDIEAIVQRRVRLIPAFHGRELHVRADRAGGVRFVFEGHEYPSMDDIPNLTARQLIADAIKEWEETA